MLFPVLNISINNDNEPMFNFLDDMVLMYLKNVYGKYFEKQCLDLKLAVISLIFGYVLMLQKRK